MRIRTLAALLATPLMAAGVALPTIGAANAGQNGTTLSETVSASATQQTVYGWTLGKTADPASQAIWKDDTATVTYTVTATKTQQGTSDPVVSGHVKITNGGSVATAGLMSSLILTSPPSTAAIAPTPVSLDVSQHPVLAAGETWDYPFSFTVPGLKTGPSYSYKLLADTTITNHSGHLGTPFGPNAAADNITLTVKGAVNDQLAVSDTYGGDHTFTASGDWTYQQVFTDAGDHANTVSGTLADGTEVSATATAHVDVYQLGVEKKVTGTSLTRTYKWALGDVAPGELKVHVGDTNVQYSVPVTVTAQDSKWAAEGTVTLTNPAPAGSGLKATITALSGQLGQAFDAFDINGQPVSMPITLDPGQSVTIHFTLALGDDTGGENVATATMILPNLNVTTTVTGSAAVGFGQAKVTEVDKAATVTNHAEIKAGDSGATSTKDGTVQVTEP